jgi:hypothetical protein
MWTDDHGMLVLAGRLPPELGALVQRALMLAEERLPPWAPPGPTASSGEDVTAVTSVVASTPEQRRTDALALLATSALDHELRCGSAADHTQVVLHVDAEVLVDEEAQGECRFEGGGDVPAETARRLSCDAAVVTLRHEADGRVLSVGRKTRTIPPAIRRALRSRDDRCRFPGCDHARFL